MRKTVRIYSANENKQNHHQVYIYHKEWEDLSFECDRAAVKLRVQFTVKSRFLDLQPDLNEKENDKRLREEVNHAC